MRRSVVGTGVSVLTTALVGAGLVAGALAGQTAPARSWDLGSGSAWFAARRSGTAVLIDGVTAQPVHPRAPGRAGRPG